jgi:hypothetical protein
MEKYLASAMPAFSLVGLALVFVFLPYCWLRRRRKGSLRKIVLAFVLAGTCVPLIMTPVGNIVSRHGGIDAERSFDKFALVLWPSSMYLMALDTPVPPPVSSIALMYAISAAANAGWYGSLGLLCGMAWSLGGRIARRETLENNDH